VNHATGRAYETELCEGSEPLGIMLLGDSAGAHFHVPYQYLFAPELTRVMQVYLSLWCFLSRGKTGQADMLF
jgi:hypothetical protein